MEYLGYLAAVLIGISLGLIGGGGSILTVPVLVYLFHLEPVLATSYSLFIVGVTSFTGAMHQFYKRTAKPMLALPLGIVSPLTVFLTRRYLMPLVPDVLFEWGDWVMTKNTATLILFSILMLAAAISMLKPIPLQKFVQHSRQTAPLESLANISAQKRRSILVFYAIGIGLITGILGAGGGFLIIPALVFLLKIPMKEAVGTSLFIIAINSLIGFLGDWGIHTINWKLLTSISLIAVSGIFVGLQLGKKISGDQLKKGFGWFVLAMGTYIILRQF